MKSEKQTNGEQIQIEVLVRQIREQTNPISPSAVARFVKPAFLKITPYDQKFTHENLQAKLLTLYRAIFLLCLTSCDYFYLLLSSQNLSGVGGFFS